jgi:membrane protease YdiL (CAAX protease family)
MYEALFLLYFAGWEFLWRGYMLFGLRRHMGDGAAVLAQMLPFVLLHFGKPPAETFGAVAAGVVLGALALRTRSFWYGAAVHWTIMLLMDGLSVLRWRAGAPGAGADDLLRIARHLLSV